MADCAQAYFRDTEKLETMIILCADIGQKKCPLAGALMIQKTPDLPIGLKIWKNISEPWREAAILAGTLNQSELLDPNLLPNDLLLQLFHEYDVRVFDCKPLQHACRCNRERVANTLSAFSQTEVETLKEEGLINVTCKFCGLTYVFNELEFPEIYGLYTNS